MDAISIDRARRVPQIRKSVLVPHSASRMFDLVADVGAYPQFMPWCGGARVRQEEADVVLATIDIRFGAVRSAFTTRNRHHRAERIEMQFAQGPFSALSGQWHFDALGKDACKVLFALDYEFASGLAGRVIAPVFDRIAASFVDAFAARAEALYG